MGICQLELDFSARASPSLVIFFTYTSIAQADYVIQRLQKPYRTYLSQWGGGGRGSGVKDKQQ